MISLDMGDSTMKLSANRGGGGAKTLRTIVDCGGCLSKYRSMKQWSMMLESRVPEWGDERKNSSKISAMEISNEGFISIWR